MAAENDARDGAEQQRRDQRPVHRSEPAVPAPGGEGQRNGVCDVAPDKPIDACTGVKQDESYRERRRPPK